MVNILFFCSFETQIRPGVGGREGLRTGRGVFFSASSCLVTGTMVMASAAG